VPVVLTVPSLDRKPRPSRRDSGRMRAEDEEKVLSWRLCPSAVDGR